MGRELAGLHLAGVSARGMQPRTAGSVDRAGVVPIERNHVALIKPGAGLHVGEAFPAAPDAVDLVADLGRAIDDALDDGIQSGNVAAAGEDADAKGSSHSCLPWMFGRSRPDGWRPRVCRLHHLKVARTHQRQSEVHKTPRECPGRCGAAGPPGPQHAWWPGGRRGAAGPPGPQHAWWLGAGDAERPGRSCATSHRVTSIRQRHAAGHGCRRPRDASSRSWHAPPAYPAAGPNTRRRITVTRWLSARSVAAAAPGTDASPAKCPATVRSDSGGRGHRRRGGPRTASPSGPDHRRSSSLRPWPTDAPSRRARSPAAPA